VLTLRLSPIPSNILGHACATIEPPAALLLITHHAPTNRSRRACTPQARRSTLWALDLRGQAPQPKPMLLGRQTYAFNSRPSLIAKAHAVMSKLMPWALASRKGRPALAARLPFKLSSSISIRGKGHAGAHDLRRVTQHEDLAR